MNLHPIFVHFPIALLSLYTVIELARFKQITEQPTWFYIKAILVLCGTAGALVAIFFGDIAAAGLREGLVTAQVNDPNSVIHLHEFFAKAGTAIFMLPAAGYAVAWLNKYNFINSLPGNVLKSIWRLGTKIQELIIETPLVIFLVIIGIILITMAATLGASIVYGPDNDPFVKIIYHLFFQ